MKIIRADKITAAVRAATLEANYFLPEDVRKAMEYASDSETAIAKSVIGDLLKNARMAADEELPICQDCGLAVIFVRLGQDVRIEGASLNDALNEGVRQAYTQGYLRKSCVAEPLYDRKNTQDNTPAIVHTELTEGQNIHITIAPKGGGSENASRLAMLKPSDGEEGIENFVINTLKETGCNACPPLVVGVGIGGNFETVALVAKKALLRPLNERNADARYAALEKKLLEKINTLGIGPAGFGGNTTALAVNIEFLPTHIACLPVAVNLSCHALRHVEIKL